MNRYFILLTIALTCLGLFAATAEAKRFGGGGSFGKQRSFSQQDMQRSPAAAPAPAQPGAQPQPAGNRWLGPLAGLALGAGLGAMFAGGGFGGAMGSILMAVAAAAVVMFLVSLFRRSQQRPVTQYAAASPYFQPSPVLQPAGGDSAAPYQTPLRSDIPADFPVEAFLRSAKTSFIRLQAANDRKDLDDIREYTTPEVFAEISMQLQERDNTPQKTDVLALEAELLRVENSSDYAVASVRFTGQLRENEAAPDAVDEIWHVQKSLHDDKSVWLLAGIQQSTLH